MFTTIEHVKEVTGYDVTQETIIMAQNIIESFVGRDEIDVVNAGDRDMLGKATAYQSAYMHNDEAKVFEQMNVSQIGQMGQMVTFRDNVASPFIAPLAVIACQRLSWRRMRSIKTGPLWYRAPVREGWSYE